VAGGWLDEIVEPADVLARAQSVAAAATALHAGAHLASKLRARQSAVRVIRAGIDGLPAELTG